MKTLEKIHAEFIEQKKQEILQKHNNPTLLQRIFNKVKRRS